MLANPKVVIPSIMTGAAVGGALAGWAGITLSAPIGGIFTLPLVNNVVLYLVFGAVGVLVTALMMGFLMKDYSEKKA
jgi:PTS system fructose-specific IIC component